MDLGGSSEDMPGLSQRYQPWSGETGPNRVVSSQFVAPKGMLEIDESYSSVVVRLDDAANAPRRFRTLATVIVIAPQNFILFREAARITWISSH